MGLGAVAWAVLRVQLPPADFTFINETEVKSLDWAVVTGIPEHRIVGSIFEGLTRLDPKTLEPLPGVAERWDISDDKKTYTFHLRKDANWSNGEPVTAHDFLYSLRRFLDPQTAAEYAYQAWYLVNARRYSIGAKGIGPGDPVEVELNERPAGALPFARGEVLRGKLVRIDGDETTTACSSSRSTARNASSAPAKQATCRGRHRTVQASAARFPRSRRQGARRLHDRNAARKPDAVLARAAGLPRPVAGESDVPRDLRLARLDLRREHRHQRPVSASPSAASAIASGW